jgi:peptide deformylase
MAVREILKYPDPQLHRKSRPVEVFDEALVCLAEDMVETMQKAGGIGLAAPQIGELLRLVVVFLPFEDGQGESLLYKVCNPRITESDGEAKIEEGCLSCPGFSVEVERAGRITVEGENLDGSPFRLEADGLLSICLQHEIDHLEGKLLVNYVGPVKRELYKSEMKRRERAPEKFKDLPPAL